MTHKADVLVHALSACFCVLDASVSLEDRPIWERDDGGEFRRMIARGEMIACLLHAPGVFKLRFRLADAYGGPSESDLSWTFDTHELHLLTGCLAVRDSDHGSQLLHLLSIAPGWYRVYESWNTLQEGEHWGLASADAYPVGDGPDGIFTLVPLADP